METIHTIEAKALVDLQKKDTALAALTARVAEVPVKVAALRKTFEAKKLAMNTARAALTALQVKKKNVELSIAEADESVRKHQRELNQVKDNNVFKALLTEIEHDKKVKDDLETEELGLLEEIDQAAAQDKLIQGEVKVIEGTLNTEIAALEAEGHKLSHELELATAERAAAAAAITPDLVDKYEAIRAGKGSLAIAEAHEDPTNGKLSCGGCHMSMTPQKMLDLKKHDTLTVCGDCRRLMYLEKTIYGDKDAQPKI
jgi:predicted  nucleic acid-binding Zn-ribbon protein